MAKRRRSENSGLDEVDRSLYTSFCHAANSISQLFTQAQQQQKVAFQSGQRIGLEKVFEWIIRQHQVGLNPTTIDIMNFLKNELESLMQAEMATVQPQQQSASASHLQQQLPPPPFARTGLPSDQGRISLPTGFIFPSDSDGQLDYHCNS